MSNESWRDVMSLLGLVILADERVYKEEVDIFVKTAISLNKKVNPGLFLTQDMALKWFVENRERLQKIQKSPVYHSKVDRIIGSLSRVANQTDIIDGMEAIACADKDYHRSEHFIINRAIELWRLKVA